MKLRALVQCLKLHFIFLFLQVYRDSNEGERFIQFYHVTSYPYLAVLDPRTGIYTKLVNSFIPTQSSLTAVLYKTELKGTFYAQAM